MGEVQFASTERRKRNKVTSCRHSLRIINPSSWWSEIQGWCRTKGQVPFTVKLLGCYSCNRKIPNKCVSHTCLFTSFKYWPQKCNASFSHWKSLFHAFFDGLTTLPLLFSQLFIIWVQLLMVFTRASSRDPVTVQMFCDRKPVKTVDLGTPQQPWVC